MKKYNHKDNTTLVEQADKFSIEQLIEALKYKLSDLKQASIQNILPHYKELMTIYEGLLNSVEAIETSGQSPRRYTSAMEGDIAEKKSRTLIKSKGISPLPAIHKPDFFKEITDAIFIKTPSQKMIDSF